MQLKITIALLVSIMLLGACNVVNKSITIDGSGKMITESRSVSDFDRVYLIGSGDVVVRQGNSEGLTIETDDNIMDYIKTRVRSNTLYLEIEEGKSISPTRLRFSLNVIDLNAVTITGSGKVTAESLDTDSLRLDIQGSGRVDIDTLTADTTNMNVSGSGRINLAGTTPDVYINVSGSGDIDISDLRCSNANVDISGSGKVTLWVTDDLNGHISGSGTVNYYGNPSTDMSVAGSGRFHNMGDK